MTAAIPASQLVDILGSVLSAGGQALQMTGVCLTANPRFPAGPPTSFASALDVATYAGDTSNEALLADTYFNGFDNRTAVPAAMKFVFFDGIAPHAAWLRGGSVAAYTLAELKALTGTLTITVNGVVKTSGAINLTAATSFSNAATIIQTAFATFLGTVTYDAISGGFLFTTTATGSTETITVAGGTNSLAVDLALTTATGATLSQGTDIGVAAVAMDALTAADTNWATFAVVSQTGAVDNVGFSAWNDAQGNRYAFVLWDTDVSNTTSSQAENAEAAIIAAGYSGTIMNYATLTPTPEEGELPIATPQENIAAFVMGTIASIDFARLNGRITLAYKSQSGIVPDITDETSANNLIGYGMNFYGDWDTANQSFYGYAPGQITGPFKWADSYVNQIWLRNAFQLALMIFLFQVNSIPFTQFGYTSIRQVCMGPIVQGVQFGGIVPGTTLSFGQINSINTALGGKDGASAVAAIGWFLDIEDPGAEVRGVRGTPEITFWYADGGSVQQITMSAIEVQ